MIIVSETQKPPVGIWGGSVWDWERDADPFNPNAVCWIALDHWGTQIGICYDGAEINESAYSIS